MQWTEIFSLCSDGGDRAGQDEFSAAAIAQITDQAAGALAVDHDAVVFGAAAGDRRQMDHRIEAPMVEPQQILSGRKIALRPVDGKSGIASAHTDDVMV